jgi:hypothetical protein
VQLDRVAIAKIETGLRCAFDFEVRALAAALEVDADFLLGINIRSKIDTANRKVGRETKT